MPLGDDLPTIGKFLVNFQEPSYDRLALRV